MTIFMASVEASLYMARHAMMERSVDIVVREIQDHRACNSLTHNQLKTEICKSGMLGKSVQSCVDAMSIWMQPINTANFAMVAPPHFCVEDESEPINPLLQPTGTEFAYGSDNEIMLMRICLKRMPILRPRSSGPDDQGRTGRCLCPDLDHHLRERTGLRPQMTRLRQSFRAFSRDDRGTLLVEFLFLLPMMIWGFIALVVYWDVFRTMNICSRRPPIRLPT